MVFQQQSEIQLDSLLKKRPENDYLQIYKLFRCAVLQKWDEKTWRITKKQ